MALMAPDGSADGSVEEMAGPDSCALNPRYLRFAVKAGSI
jgi:hypothetical protein